MRCFIGIDVGAQHKAFEKMEIPTRDGIQRAKDYHITLEFWPDIHENTLKAISNKVATFNHKPFHFSLDTVIAMPSSKAPELYALAPSDATALIAMRNAVKKHMADVALFGKRFHPHVTLARKASLSPGATDDQELLRACGPLVISVDSLTLYTSLPEQGMNTYFKQNTFFS